MRNIYNGNLIVEVGAMVIFNLISAANASILLAIFFRPFPNCLIFLKIDTGTIVCYSNS